jgi:hypothetical protein
MWNLLYLSLPILLVFLLVGFGSLSFIWFRVYYGMRNRPYRSRQYPSLMISLLFLMLTILVSSVFFGILTGTINL